MENQRLFHVHVLARQQGFPGDVVVSLGWGGDRYPGYVVSG